MKKRIAAIIAALAVMLCASGCQDIFAYEYSRSFAYRDETAYDSIEGGADVKSIAQLRKAIQDLVAIGDEEGMLRFSNYSGNPADDLAEVCFEVRNANPMGAYAVESIEYELSRIVSYYTANVKINYSRTPEEIAAVRQITTVAELRMAMDQLIENNEDGMTFRIYSTLVNEDVIRKIAAEEFLANPVRFLNEPEAVAKGYPEDGANRIYEVSISYALDSETVEGMKAELESALETAQSYIAADNGALTALACANYLHERCWYDGTSSGTAHTAFTGGICGSRGFALAYKALCDGLGVNCRVVRGKLGTFGTDEHYWNIIEVDGDYYHVDVSRMGEEEIDKIFLASDDSLWGLYTWEPGDYPSCDGKLSYSDVITVETATAEATTQNGENEIINP